MMQGLENLHLLPSMKTLNELDYERWEDWKLNLELTLTFMDLDYALHNEQPTLTDTSSPEHKANYERWERSNRLSLMIMKQKLSDGLCGLVRDTTDNAKQFLAKLEDLFMGIEKAQACSLLQEFVNMRYDGQGNVHEHILKMSHIAKRLGAVGICFSESAVVRSALNSLPSQFGPFRIAFTVQKEEWGLNKLISLCASEEERLRQEKRGQAEFTEKNEDGKKLKRLDDCDGPQGQNAKKRRDIHCYFCGREGHVRRDCPVDKL